MFTTSITGGSKFAINNLLTISEPVIFPAINRSAPIWCVLWRGGAGERHLRAQMFTPTHRVQREWLITSDAIRSARRSKLMQRKLESLCLIQKWTKRRKAAHRNLHTGSAEDITPQNAETEHQIPRRTYRMVNLPFFITQKYPYVNNKALKWRCSFPEKWNLSFFLHSLLLPGVPGISEPL